MAGLVPEETLNRRKMGFGMPVGNWLRGELNGMLRENILSKRSLGRGYLKPAEVTRLVEEHSAGRKDYSYQLWALLMLELWHLRFIDGET
jgi:asparagine synthase (glutamine-hydrolysing)